MLQVVALVETIAQFRVFEAPHKKSKLYWFGNRRCFEPEKSRPLCAIAGVKGVKTEAVAVYLATLKRGRPERPNLYHEVYEALKRERTWESGLLD